MSVEISLITSLLGVVLGSSPIAGSVVELFKMFYNEKNKQIAVEATDGTKTEDTSVPLLPEKYVSSKTEVEIATDAAIKALDSTYSSATSIRDERIRQAKLAFNTALILMIMGVVIIFVGIGILLAGGSLESGIITVASGTVSEIISAIVFKFNKETNNRLDEIRKELARIEMAKVGLSIAKEISDLEKRDLAIADLTKIVQNYG